MLSTDKLEIIEVTKEVLPKQDVALRRHCRLQLLLASLILVYSHSIYSFIIHAISSLRRVYVSYLDYLYKLISLDCYRKSTRWYPLNVIWACTVYVVARPVTPQLYEHSFIQLRLYVGALFHCFIIFIRATHILLVYWFLPV